MFLFCILFFEGFIGKKERRTELNEVCNEIHDEKAKRNMLERTDIWLIRLHQVSLHRIVTKFWHSKCKKWKQPNKKSEYTFMTHSTHKPCIMIDIYVLIQSMNLLRGNFDWHSHFCSIVKLKVFIYAETILLSMNYLSIRRKNLNGQFGVYYWRRMRTVVNAVMTLRELIWCSLNILID